MVWLLSAKVTVMIYLDFLDCHFSPLDPLSHVLLLHLNDVVGDGSAAVRCRGCPGQLGEVGTPVDDVWFAAWVRHVPRVPHQNVISTHLTRVRLPDLVHRLHPEPVLVVGLQVLNLGSPLIA